MPVYVCVCVCPVAYIHAYVNECVLAYPRVCNVCVCVCVLAFVCVCERDRDREYASITVPVRNS